MNIDYELKEADSNEIIKELYIEHERNKLNVKTLNLALENKNNEIDRLE